MKEQEKKQEILNMEMEEIKKIHNEKIEQLENDWAQNDLQMKEQEKKREILKTEMEEFRRILNRKIEQLENYCAEKDLQVKEQEKKQEILNTKVEEIKKIHNEKIEQLENDCVQKDLRMKEQEKLLEILKTENEDMKKVQNQKTDQLNQLKSTMNELKREKQEQERLNTKMKSDYENLEKAFNRKDLQMREQEKLLENLKNENNRQEKLLKEPANRLRNEVEELKAEKELQEKLGAKMASDYENLKEECAKKDDQMKRQERLLENVRTGNRGSRKLQRDQVDIWKKKVDELNTEKEEQEKLKAMVSDYQNLLQDTKDLEMKKQATLLETLKTENEETLEKKEQLRNEVNKLKAEKQAKEKMKAEKTSDHQEKEKESVKKDFQENKQPKDGEMKRESKMETGNKEEAKRERLLMDGLLAHENKRFDEAMAIFIEALAIDTDKEKQTALLRILRAEANAASGNPLDMNIVLNYCQAIEKGLQGCRVYMLRGKHFLKLGLFDSALNDFEAARMVKESEECLKFIEDAKALKKKWESQSHYEVLVVGQTATRAEILKSFRGLSMKLHPDRHRDKPEFLQGAFEEKFKKDG
ncbi:golgin subfamily A member 6-like protein 22 [Palaemon carinicauda]|uniref:golgin subfamily A member 6-like protein 22 n=1 Tax=Palaemon carinicauda TaxID=392227 RepID=UPI0035B6370B